MEAAIIALMVLAFAVRATASPGVGAPAPAPGGAPKPPPKPTLGDQLQGAAQNAVVQQVGGAVAAAGTAAGGILFPASGGAAAAAGGGAAAAAGGGSAAAAGGATAAAGGGSATATGTAGASIAAVALPAAAMAAVFVGAILGVRELNAYNAKVERQYSLRLGLDLLADAINKELAAAGFADSYALAVTWRAETAKALKGAGVQGLVAGGWYDSRVAEGQRNVPTSQWTGLDTVRRADGFTYKLKTPIPLANPAGNGFAVTVQWFIDNPGAPYLIQPNARVILRDGTEAGVFQYYNGEQYVPYSENRVTGDFVAAGFPEWRVRNAYRYSMTGNGPGKIATFTPPNDAPALQPGMAGSIAPVKPRYMTGPNDSVEPRYVSTQPAASWRTEGRG